MTAAEPFLITSCLINVIRRARPGPCTLAIQVHEELTAALEPGVTTVTLDLTPTTSVDSAGLSKIADARRLACAYRIDLRVVAPPTSPLAGFLASSGFGRVLAIIPPCVPH